MGQFSQYYVRYSQVADGPENHHTPTVELSGAGGQAHKQYDRKGAAISRPTAKKTRKE